jgi:hypothetical protein
MSEGEKFTPKPEGSGEAPPEEKRSGEVNAEMIARASSLDQLCEMLRSVKRVVGSSYNQSGADVVRRIEQVRYGHRTIEDHRITRAMGIRDTVERLLQDDPKYIKCVLKKRK